MIIKGAKGTEAIKAYEEYEKRSQKEVGLMLKAYRKDFKYPAKEECESIYPDNVAKDDDLFKPGNFITMGPINSVCKIKEAHKTYLLVEQVVKKDQAQIITCPNYGMVE